MFTLTITLDEKSNSVKIHGVGNTPTDGEKYVAGQISSSIKDLTTGELPSGLTFNSDLKTNAPSVTSPAPEDRMDLDDMLGELA